jgi:hypothetical protein
LCLTAFACIVLSITSKRIAAAEFYLTNDGNDESNCRTLSTSCQTISRILRDVQDGDVINVIEEEDSRIVGTASCRWLCNESSIVNIDVSVTIVGTGSLNAYRNKSVATSCADCLSFDSGNDIVAGKLVVFNVSGENSESPVRFRIENLVLVNVTFLVAKSYVAFFNSVVIDSNFSNTSPPDESDDETYVGLELVGSVWKTMMPGTKGSVNREVILFLSYHRPFNSLRAQ